MKGVGALFILLAIPCVLASLVDDWEAFKNEYGLYYETAAEDHIRMARFKNGLSIVNDHNNKHKGDKSAASMKMHPIGLLSDEEFANQKLGLKHDKKNVTAEVQTLPSLTTLPASFDWRTVAPSLLTPVQNQGNCGSCWAFSATGALEGQWFKKTGQLINLSEQQLVDCGSSVGLGGCNGGWMDTAFYYVLTNGGLDTEASYPYTGVQGTICKYNNATIGAKDVGWVDVGGDDASMMSAVVNVGPLSVAIGVSGNSGYYSGGIFTPNMCVSSINHGVLLVGYGQDTSGNNYWILKNSWGSVWGGPTMAGYFLYPRGSTNCTIQYPSYPAV